MKTLFPFQMLYHCSGTQRDEAFFFQNYFTVTISKWALDTLVQFRLIPAEYRLFKMQTFTKCSWKEKSIEFKWDALCFKKNTNKMLRCVLRVGMCVQWKRKQSERTNKIINLRLACSHIQCLQHTQKKESSKLFSILRNKLLFYIYCNTITYF